MVVNDIGASMDGQGLDKGVADQVVDEIKAAGGEAVACTDTVADANGAKAILQAAMDTWGRLDVLIHNAGNVRRGAMDEISDEDFLAVLDVHLIGGWRLVPGAFPIMKKAGYGRVVLAASVVGLYGNTNAPNYTVSKMGLIGLSNMAALEGKDVGIKSNCILPGALTRMADGAKNLDPSTFPPTMQPEMVAPVVGYLAHESCAVSGELYSSIGGRVSRAWVAENPGCGATTGASRKWPPISPRSATPTSSRSSSRRSAASPTTWPTASTSPARARRRRPRAEPLRSCTAARYRSCFRAYELRRGLVPRRRSREDFHEQRGQRERGQARP